ncbi:MAG TPA: hypothetical protein VJ813_01655 [Vicinamibacterales bacterium]|nr:hypothetical protein [Vicinamibacterales bacterium]
MAGSKTGRVWGTCLLAIIVLGGAVAPAAAGASYDATCVVPPVPSFRASAWQEVAASRTGKIPGLGSISAAIGWDNRKHVTLVGPGFQVTRAFTPLTREVEIGISGEGDDPLVIRFGNAEGLTVLRAGQVIRGTADADALRSVLGGRAVAAFRDRIGTYERRLIGGTAGREDDAHADGFLLAGAFVASMAGDPMAVGRARDLIMRRIHGKTRSVRFDFKDCVTEYELYLLKIDTQRTLCLEAANSRDSWYARAADRLGCEAEYMAQVLAGEGQFISCTALGSIIG